MLLHVLGWVLVGIGMLGVASNVIKLTIGRAKLQVDGPGARREAWSDLRYALTAAAGGLVALIGVDSKAGALMWLLVALILAYSSWQLFAAFRRRKAGNRDGEVVEDASKPFASPGGEHQSPRMPSYPAMTASAAEIAEWVDGTIFSTTRLRPGYSQEEVDVFLDTVRDAFLGVSETAVTSDEVRNIRFAKTRFRPGYDEEDVDKFLDQVLARLAT